jgi:hypothetical protein
MVATSPPAAARAKLPGSGVLIAELNVTELFAGIVVVHSNASEI